MRRWMLLALPPQRWNPLNWSMGGMGLFLCYYTYRCGRNLETPASQTSSHDLNHSGELPLFQFPLLTDLLFVDVMIGVTQ